MSKNVKNILVASGVLLVISLICIALLALANEFMKYTPTLNEDMAIKLNEVCDTGADGSYIDYFEIVDMDEIGLNLDIFNSENIKQGEERSTLFYRKEAAVSTTFVLAVFKQTEGINKGCYIIQAQAKGRDGNVVMLTAYDKDGKILKTRAYSQVESFWAKVKDEYLDAYNGKSGEIDKDINVGTGATISLGAVNEAVNISNKLITELLKGGTV